MKQKLVIDADPGIGDALAIALALSDPDLDVIALTATAGVVSGDQATRNLQVIVETLDPAKWPRIGACHSTVPVSTYDSLGGATRPIDLHGEFGLGEFEPPVSSLHHLKDSVKLLTDLVREYPNELTLLTLGPLTNVCQAMERSPDFLDLLGGLVCFGGTDRGSGDVSPVAEFNIHADSASAQAVLTAHITKTLVPVNIARQFEFSFEELNRFDFGGAGELGKLFQSLLTFALRTHHAKLGVEAIALSEVVALASITCRDQFEREMVPLDIETAGELTTGMTVIDRRLRTNATPNIEVVTGFESSDLEHHLSRFFDPVN